LSSSSEGKRKTPGEAADSLPKKARTGDKTPLYSGDKLIPEFFAECKRVPKVPNSAGPREYAKIINDERVRPLLKEMLSELMRLQKRAIEDKNAKAKRRLVMGLREVARGIRAHKVKMVVMANNLDQYGAIDEKLQEIIDLSHSEDVPLFFEFTKRSLGKAIGKSIKVAVVGIQNADGAHQAFKKLSSIA
jgi:selenocysteine insertion sequence-binding protein 2